MKICSKCKIKKDNSKFSKCKTYKDGLQYICKSCMRLNYKLYGKEKAKIRNSKIENRIHHIEYCKIYNKTLKGKISQKYSKHKSMLKYPEKIHARWKLQDAVKRGSIIKPLTCSVCLKEFNDKKFIQAHHFDYSKPYDIVWCCQQCHEKLDKIRGGYEL